MKRLTETLILEAFILGCVAYVAFLYAQHCDGKRYREFQKSVLMLPASAIDGDSTARRLLEALRQGRHLFPEAEMQRVVTNALGIYDENAARNTAGSTADPIRHSR